MTIFFLSSTPKIPKYGIFGPKFSHFHYFTKFCSQTISRMLISIITIVFQILPEKYPNIDILFFCEILQLDKFEHVHFKYDNSFFKFQSERHFLSQIQAFCFFAKFCNQTSLTVLSNITIVFLKFQPKSTQMRHFWSQIQAFLLFCKIQQLDKFEGADFKYDNSFLKFQVKNI